MLSSAPAPVPVAASADGALSLPLSDGERDLRSRAAALSLSTSPFATALAPVSGDPAAYAAALIGAPTASSESRFSRLTDDIASDHTRLLRLLPIVATVAERDRIRGAAESYVGPSALEAAAIHARMADNAAVAARVFAILRARARAYHLALEHLVLATPSPEAVATERALIAFEHDLALAGGR